MSLVTAEIAKKDFEKLSEEIRERLNKFYYGEGIHFRMKQVVWTPSSIEWRSHGGILYYTFVIPDFIWDKFSGIPLLESGE